MSSTLAELAAERVAARASIEQLRLTPVMFESGARPHPPRALYRSYLAQSDIFVGIYWQRYGWVAPDMEISGLEDELRLSAGMPRLVYVKRPAPDMEPRLHEMLTSLEGDDGPSYKPFSDAAELGALLLDDVALLLAERFDQGTGDPAPRRSTLPAPTSSFIGRRAEIDALHRLLDDASARLITLAGPGGTGKTRLAIEVARRESERFDDGVCFVDLAGERQPEEAFGAIARSLEVSSPGATPLQRVERELSGRRLLLVLDNVEQVTSIGPGLVELLERCPRVTVLVTSREVLRVSGEHVWPVPVLSLPAPGAGRSSLDEVLRSESGRLFAERATALGAAFAPTDADADDIAAICQRLDGLPLAIELAAARVTLFSIAELRERLETRLDLLTGGGRDRPDRQRTLHDAIDWSHELLSDDERRALRLFAVFADGRLGDIEATFAEVPGANRLDVTELFSSLVDKNLVRVRPGADRRPRLSMLQTIRSFARERLATFPDELEAAERSHAEHYAVVAAELHERLPRADRTTVVAELGEELGNLRLAWEHWAARRDVARLDVLLAPLWAYYEARGDYGSALVLGDDLLGILAELPETRQRLHDEMTLRGNLARTQLIVRGFSTEAEDWITETLERFEAAGEARNRFPPLRSMAGLQLWRSDFDRAATSARELMSLAEADGDPVLLAEAHLVRCISTTWVDDLPAAIDDADAAAAYDAGRGGPVALRVGPYPGVVAHAVAGLLRWTAGRPDAALTSMTSAEDLARQLGHPYSEAFVLHHATLLDMWRSDTRSVTARAERSLHLADTHGYPIWRALALIFRGAARVSDGDAIAGIEEMEAGVALYEALPTPPIFWPSLLAVRAATHGEAGDVERALAMIERSSTELGDRDHPAAAEIAIVHGDLLLRADDGNLATARSHFERAAAQSQARRARMLELQALTRLTTTDTITDTSTDTGWRDRLQALYESFTEGLDTVPLRAAAAALHRE